MFNEINGFAVKNMKYLLTDFGSDSCDRHLSGGNHFDVSLFYFFRFEFHRKTIEWITVNGCKLRLWCLNFDYKYVSVTGLSLAYTLFLWRNWAESMKKLHSKFVCTVQAAGCRDIDPICKENEKKKKTNIIIQYNLPMKHSTLLSN